MRAKGITYDTGFAPGGRGSRPVFDTDAVRREIRVIADDLHCDAVRITGGDPERLAVAAGHAADAGLEVWFSPFPCELSTTELLPYFAECADRAREVGSSELSIHQWPLISAIAYTAEPGEQHANACCPQGRASFANS